MSVSVHRHESLDQIKESEELKKEMMEEEAKEQLHEYAARGDRVQELRNDQIESRRQDAPPSREDVQDQLPEDEEALQTGARIKAVERGMMSAVSTLRANLPLEKFEV